MKASPTEGRFTGIGITPRVFALAEPPEDFNRMIDRYRSSALCGYIHQRKFHLTVIKALDEIERYAGQPVFAWAVPRCSSCGAFMANPPLCTGCLLHL